MGAWFSLQALEPLEKEMKKKSKKFEEAQKKIDQKDYSIEDAVKKIKEISFENFDASVEAHIKLGIDVSKSDQHVKGSAVLPHGSGKKVRIAVFAPADLQKKAKEAGAEIVGGEELLEKISKTKKCDFDVAVATPDMMRHLSKVAKILGPKGLMPNPKTGTVTPDPAKVVNELQSGKINFKNDPAGIIHQIIGKKSYTDEQIVENYNTLMEGIKKVKPNKTKGEFINKITICTSMGPGVKVKA